MLVKVNKTYRGKEGLYVGGHPYDLPKSKIAAIVADCESRKETFDYEEVKDPKNINRPAQKKQAKSPSNKQQTGDQTK
jgi:hypothetical protein